MDTTTFLLLAVALGGLASVISARSLVAPRRIRAEDYVPARTAEDDELTL